MDKPKLIYRCFRSDDLSGGPIFGPVTLEVTAIAMSKKGASFEARAPRLNLNRTGETYSPDRFIGLRSLL